MTDVSPTNAGSEPTSPPVWGNATSAANKGVGPTSVANQMLSLAEAWTNQRCPGWRWMIAYLSLYAIFGALTLNFFPSYGWPDGDEATYCSYAMRPWTLTSDFFEGFRPKEVVNPYNFRLFLTPFSTLFHLVGFTHVGARWIIFSYGLVLLILIYSLARRLAPPAIALAAVVALSLSPMFVLHTHMVRPEGMMTMWLVGIVWFATRHDMPFTFQRGFAIGLLAAMSLWIHYNGIVIFPVMFLALFAVDRSFRKLAICGAYLGSGLVFALVYAALNLWPARQTIAEFGIMPITFASSNRVPLLEPEHLPAALIRSLSYYATILWNGTDGIGWPSARFTLIFLLPATWAVIQQSNQLARLLSALVGLLAAAYLFVFPNARWEYLFYVLPIVWLLAIRGLAQLPATRDMIVLVSGLFLGAASCYVFDTSAQIRLAWARQTDNERVGQALQAAVARFGEPRDVVVMGAQEFHRFVPQTQYRTFHSLITLRDFGEVLRQFSPHVVIINKRGLRAIAAFLNDHLVVNGYINLPPEIGSRWIAQGILRRDPSTGRWSLDPDHIEPFVRDTLTKQGYRRLKNAGHLRWNDNRVDIYTQSSPPISHSRKHAFQQARNTCPAS